MYCSHEMLHQLQQWTWLSIDLRRAGTNSWIILFVLKILLVLILQASLVNQPFVLSNILLTRKCVEGISRDDHLEIPDFTRELLRWINEQTDFTEIEDFSIKRQLIYKYMVLLQIDLKTHYSRLTLPTTTSFNVPIQPGLFKGTYSVHGLELISLFYEEDRNKVKAIKITVNQ